MVLAVCPSTLCTMTTKESTLERVPEALPGQPVPAYSSPQSLRQATVDIIIPVYNEEHSLPRCVDQLTAFISTEMPVPTSVIIADNASPGRSLARCVPSTTTSIASTWMRRAAAVLSNAHGWLLMQLLLRTWT